MTSQQVRPVCVLVRLFVCLSVVLCVTGPISFVVLPAGCVASLAEQSVSAGG